MPLYTFEHPETNESIDLVFGMNDEKIYIDENGIKWNRVFSSPNAALDLNSDPFSSKGFVEKTNSKGTMGDLMSRSQEMSEKRKNKLGYDPVQKKYFQEYSKKRRGVKHHLDR